MRKTIFSLLLIILLTQNIVTQAPQSSDNNGQDVVYTDCTWYCDRIKAWNAYGVEYKRTYMFESPITPKWIGFYTTLLGRCLDSGTLPDGETCDLKKLPPKIPVKCPANSQAHLGVCTACPFGTILRGKRCIKETILRCRPGFAKVGKKCIRQCKKGDHLVEGVCVKLCKSNEKLVNGVCKLNCEKNQTEVNGKCLKKCKKTQVRRQGKCVAREQCKFGYVKINGKCSKICDHVGTVLRGTKCEKINPCKPNEAYNKTTKKCLKICGAHQCVKHGKCEDIPINCGTKKSCKKRVKTLMLAKHKELQIVLGAINYETSKSLDDLDDDEDDRRRILLDYVQSTQRRIQGLKVTKQTKKGKVTIKATKPVVKTTSTVTSTPTTTTTTQTKLVKTTVTITLHPRIVYLNAKLKVIESEFTFLKMQRKQCKISVCPKGKVCKKQICVKPEVPICKKDEILKDNKCVKACSAGLILVKGACIHYCKKPTVWNGKKCEIKCDAGLTLVDGHCKIVCPFGYKLEKGKCVESNPCPDGQRLSRNKKCQSICKKDEEYKMGQCVKKIVCLKTEILTDGECVKVCREDEVLNAKNQCQKKCQPGWVLRGDTCVHVCPDGQYLGADCVCHDQLPQCFTKAQCVIRYNNLIFENEKKIVEAKTHLKGTPIAKHFKRNLQAMIKKPIKNIGGYSADKAVWRETLYHLEANTHTYNIQKAKCYVKKCNKHFKCTNMRCIVVVPKKECKFPMVIVLGKCVKQQPPMCPPHSKRNAAGICIKTKIIKLITKCKKPFVKRGKHCVRIVPKIQINCPQGSHLVKGKCVKDIGCLAGYK